MRIGVDLDNVLYDFVAALGDYVSFSTGRPRHELGRATCWEFYDKDWGYTLEEFKQFCEDGVNDGFVFAEGAPIGDHVHYLQGWRNLGDTIHLVTDRHNGTRSKENTEHWLNYWNIPYDTLTFAVDKTVVNVDFFIDDKPSNVDALRAAGVKAYLLDCGRSDQVGHPYLVSSFMQFERQIGGWLTDQAAQKSETILEEAQRIIHGPRRDHYGHPRKNFEDIAAGWSVIMDTPVTAEQVGQSMIWVKICREKNSPQRDNKVDIAGYAGTLEMLEEPV